MTDDVAWVSTVVRQPHDRELVYARVKYGQPKKVRFFATPTPRWEGASIVYQFGYFAEWVTLADADRKPPRRDE